MEININCPEYRGAPMPKFKIKCINESEFSDEERFKDAYVEFDPNGTSEIEWICQVADHHSDEWSNEIIRAFKTNGAKNGHVINVRFGSRDFGITEEFELIVC